MNYNPLAVCKNLQLMGIFINHWYRPAKFDLDLLNETYQKSLEIGNLVFADYCLTVNCLTTYCVGKPLSDVFGVTNQAVAFSKQTSRSIFYPPVVLQRYLIHILEGNKKVTEYDLDAVLEKIIVGEDKTGAGCCCMLRCSLFFLMGDYKNALRLAQKSFSFRPFIKGLTADAETLLYYSLTMIKLYKEATPKEKRNFKKLLKSFIHEFALWSKACPVNYKHKYLIILAEQANLYNKKEEAQKLYDQAIAAAMESEYLHMIAIFNELAAIFNFSQGKIENGEKYLAKAHEYYRKWGGLAKCELLERQYSQFINP